MAVAEHHHCDAVVIGCTDYRTEIPMDGVLRENRHFVRDRVLLPGIARDLAQSHREAFGAALLDKIVSVIDGHHPDEVLIFTHDDCLAYGGRVSFSSPEEERDVLTEDLYRATEAINNRFPAGSGPVFRMFFIRDTESGSPVAYEVH